MTTWIRALVLFLILITTLPTTAAAQSPDNSRVPPLASVTGSAGSVFTFAPGSSGASRVVLRNGVDTQGAGSVILIWKLTPYVLGDDAQWYQYTGATGWPWLVVGADPSGGPIVEPPPPVIVTALSRLGWIQPGQTVAQAKAGVTRLYIDTAAGAVLAGVVCTVVSGATDCTAPIPALTPGTHTLAITYTPAGGVATGKSNVVAVTSTVTLTPVALGLRK